MKPIKLRSGTVGVGVDGGKGVAVAELAACVMAVYMRQVISKSFVFMHHNDLESFADFNKAMSMSMAYAIVSKSGVGNLLKPYLEIAREKGCLKPEQVKDNKYGERVLALYPNAHAAYMSGGEDGLVKWALDYSYVLLEDEQAVLEEAIFGDDFNPNDIDDIDDFSNSSSNIINQSLSPKKGTSLSLSHSPTSQTESTKEDEENDVKPMELGSPNGNVKNTNNNSIYNEEDNNDDDDDDDECHCDFCEEMRETNNIDLLDIQPQDSFEAQFLVTISEGIRKHNEAALAHR